MLPVDLRDELFALFRAALAAPDAVASFSKGVERPLGAALPGSERLAYLHDRIPRFVAVLLAAPGVLGEPGTWPRDVGIARLLFNEGLFFDCHEFLEPLWNKTSGSDKTLLQGLIQAGAGLHKLEMGSPKGCMELLRKAAEKLRGHPGGRGKALAAFAARLEDTAARVERGDFQFDQAPDLDPEAV